MINFRALVIVVVHVFDDMALVTLNGNCINDYITIKRNLNTPTKYLTAFVDEKY